MVLVLLQVKMSHPNFSKISRMESIKVDPVMVLTTSKTATSGMFAVLSDTPVAGTDVPALLAVLL